MLIYPYFLQIFIARLFHKCQNLTRPFRIPSESSLGPSAEEGENAILILLWRLVLRKEKASMFLNNYNYASQGKLNFDFDLDIRY